jgi:hypothetical protein
MADMPDWTTWALAASVCVLFLWFFWHVAASLFSYARQVVGTIQNWPQVRRSMVEAEAKAGGRYPLWFRMVRAFLVLAMVGLVVLIVWRRFG